jgi:hypothetical protein
MDVTAWHIGSTFSSLHLFRDSIRASHPILIEDFNNTFPDLMAGRIVPQTGTKFIELPWQPKVMRGGSNERSSHEGLSGISKTSKPVDKRPCCGNM